MGKSKVCNSQLPMSIRFLNCPIDVTRMVPVRHDNIEQLDVVEIVEHPELHWQV